MKKLLLLFFVFISLNTFGQISLGVGESKTIEGGEWSVQMNEGAILYIKGYTTITSLNKYKNAVINIDKDAVVTVESSINMQGSANLFVFGKLMTTNIEVHGDLNAINVQGKLQSFSNFILNDNTSEIQVCGEVEINNVTNWNPQTKEKQIVLCDCGTWKTWKLNSSTKNIVTGMGSVFYESGNIKEQLSTSSTIVINRDCKEALPVSIASFDVKYNKSGEVEYNLKLSEDSTPKTIIIQSSEDGKIWKEVIRREVKGTVNNNFSGIIK